MERRDGGGTDDDCLHHRSEGRKSFAPYLNLRTSHAIRIGGRSQGSALVVCVRFVCAEGDPRLEPRSIGRPQERFGNSRKRSQQSVPFQSNGIAKRFTVKGKCLRSERERPVVFGMNARRRPRLLFRCICRCDFDERETAFLCPTHLYVAAMEMDQARAMADRNDRRLGKLLDQCFVDRGFERLVHG